MSRFEEQNASFWSVRWLILKTGTKNNRLFVQFFYHFKNIRLSKTIKNLCKKIRLKLLTK